MINEKVEWTSPEIEEFDIAERTQLEGGEAADGVDPRGGLLGGGTPGS